MTASATANWGMVEMDDLLSRLRLKRELGVVQGLVDLKFHHAERNVVLLFWAADLDTRRKQYRIVVLVVAVMRISDECAGLIINELAFRQQIFAAENNFA